MDEGKLITTRQLADFFGVTVQTVYQWSYKGLIVPIRLHPSKHGPVRFTLDEIERFINRSRGGKEWRVTKISSGLQMESTK